MSFLPEEEVKKGSSINLAPMIDFLFLMLAFFASLAVTRVATRDTDIELVKVAPESASPPLARDEEMQLVHVTVGEDGSYCWVTEIRDYPMESAQSIADELCHQHERGLLPSTKEKTQVLVRIDRAAQWEQVAQLIFAVRDAGFQIRPVYEVGDPEP